MPSNQPKHHQPGFSLLELIIVLAIIAIGLVAIIPVNTGKIDQTNVAEAIALVKQYQYQVEGYYRTNKDFPADNEAIGMPPADKVRGNYLAAVYLDKGALHLQLGNKIRPELVEKVLSIRPVIVPGVDNAPVSWICGYDSVPEKMIAVGSNRTDLAPASLPMSCR